MATPEQGRLERRLAAIQAADVAGYAGLMGADSARHGLCANIGPPSIRSRRAAADASQDHRRRLPSIVAAVKCAVAIQNLMAEDEL